MKKRIWSILLTLCMVLAMDLTVFAASGTITGTGSEDSPFLIEDVADLKAFRDAVNNGNNYSGKYVKLNASIDVSNQEWTPIGNGTRSDSSYTGNAFAGIFDGGGYSITGLGITTGDSGAAVGLFGVVDGGTVKNLTLSDVFINLNSNKNAGAAIGLMVNGSTAHNITVSGSVSAVDGVGGIVGRMTISGTISDCTNNATVTATATGAGGIVGKAYYTAESKAMTISGCVNNGAVTGGYAAGGIAALSAANVSGCTNTAAITAGTMAGGIIGEQTMYGTISGNTNSGTISNSTSGSGTAYGGIVGWARYANSTTDYPLYEAITISDNINSGNISASGASLGCGGIVGTIYNQAVVTGNTNTAQSITGGTFASGIVGGAQVENNNLDISGKTIMASNNVSTTALSEIAANCVSSDMYSNDSQFVAKENSDAWVAQIGTSKYATLQAAIDAAVSGDTIALIADVATSGTVTVPEGLTVTLNLGSFNITGTPAELAAYAVIHNNGNLTITGSGTILCDHKLSGSTAYAVNTILNTGTLTINGGTVKNVSTAASQIGYAIDNNSTSRDAILTIDGGAVTASGSYYYDGIRQFCNSESRENTVTVLSGSVSSIWLQNPSDGNSGRNTKDVKGSITISGGSVNALYLEPSTSFAASVTGGSIGSVSSFETAENRDLTGFITGGEFVNAPGEDYLAEGYVLESYTNDAGDTVYGAKPTFEISFGANGGTGDMAAVTVTAGDYVLPACGFTAPAGTRFKGWSVDGNEYAVGATIVVSANTTVTAVWEHVHVYDNEVATDAYRATGATCEKKATYYKSCACGAAGTETFEYGELADHTWSEATCTDPKTCSVCGVSEGSAKGHIVSDWEADDDDHWKTCVVDGCDFVFTDTITAHTDADKNGKCDVCEYEMPKGSGSETVTPGGIDNPQTGDDSNILLWFVMLLMSGAVCVVFCYVTKSKKGQF